MHGPLPGEAHGSADAAWKAIGETDGTMPVAFQLDSPLPAVQFLGGGLLIKSGAAKGKSLMLKQVDGDKVVLGSNNLNLLAQVKPVNSMSTSTT